ncbi:MAG: hypothetical protein KDJ15_04220 [Alphaproteobacteria bacterium]|nr:hypothetical protein [Alphaproteobacteria bacterium]
MAKETPKIPNDVLEAYRQGRRDSFCAWAARTVLTNYLIKKDKQGLPSLVAAQSAVRTFNNVSVGTPLTVDMINQYFGENAPGAPLLGAVYRFVEVTLKYREDHSQGHSPNDMKKARAPERRALEETLAQIWKHNVRNYDKLAPSITHLINKLLEAVPPASVAETQQVPDTVATGAIKRWNPLAR